jgi:glucose-1-phosphate adenylyltransferase
MQPCAHAFNPDTALVSMGVYIFRKSILSGALEVICESGQGYDFGRHVIPALIHCVNTCAYTFRGADPKVAGYWRDIGTIDAYYAASMEVIRDVARFDPYANHGQPSQTSPHPKVTNLTSMRARPPEIHPTATIVRSVLSPNVEIGEGAFVCNTVLLPGVQVGAGARLCRAVVEEGVSIPTDFCAGFDIDQDRKLHTVSDSGVVVVAPRPGSLSYQVSSMSQVAVR